MTETLFAEGVAATSIRLRTGRHRMHKDNRHRILFGTNGHPSVPSESECCKTKPMKIG